MAVRGHVLNFGTGLRHIFIVLKNRLLAQFGFFLRMLLWGKGNEAAVR